MKKVCLLALSLTLALCSVAQNDTTTLKVIYHGKPVNYAIINPCTSDTLKIFAYRTLLFEDLHYYRLTVEDLIVECGKNKKEGDIEVRAFDPDTHEKFVYRIPISQNGFRNVSALTFRFLGKLDGVDFASVAIISGK